MKSEARYSKIWDSDSGEHIPNAGSMWKWSWNISRKVYNLADDGSKGFVKLQWFSDSRADKNKIIGTTEVLWNPDMEQRLAELFCRSRLFTLDAPKAVLYNEFGARLGRGEIYNKIQELKLVKRIQFDLILGGWTYPGMTKGWVGPDGAGEYGVP